MSDYIVREFSERRTRQAPIPGNLDHYLNKLQMSALLKLQELGWRLWFVRRPLFQSVTAVLFDPTETYTAVLEEDGTNNIDHGMIFRPM